jgi:hypothetical protein
MHTIHPNITRNHRPCLVHPNWLRIVNRHSATVARIRAAHAVYRLLPTFYFSLASNFQPINGAPSQPSFSTRTPTVKTPPATPNYFQSLLLLFIERKNSAHFALPSLTFYRSAHIKKPHSDLALNRKIDLLPFTMLVRQPMLATVYCLPSTVSFFFSSPFFSHNTPHFPSTFFNSLQIINLQTTFRSKNQLPCFQPSRRAWCTEVARRYLRQSPREASWLNSANCL